MTKTSVYFYFFLIIFSVLNCTNKEKEYYKSGEVKLEYEIDKGLKHGKYVQYYKSGKVKKIRYFENDTLNGVAKDFYQNGNVEIEFFMENNKINGPFYEYYKSGKLKSSGQYRQNKKNGIFKFYDEEGKIQKHIEYVIIDKESHINNVYKFNSKGEVIKSESNYLKIISLKDTIRLGEKYIARVILEAPYFEKSNMYVYFEIPHDTSSYKRIFSDNHIVKYDYIPNEVGNMKLKGFIEEFVILEQKNDSTTGKSRYLYFDKDYYVIN
jgi:hypothetical protein